MKETFELINQIINTISKTITIKSVTVNPDNTIDLQVNKTLWLTVSNRPITINGVDYKIVSITNNLLIKLFPNPTTPTVGTFEAYDFYFWHGTVIEVNNELNKIKASADKFPMCYLVEVLEEQNNYSELSPIGRSVNTRLLFAVETDYTNKDTQGLYSSGIDPTRNFVNEFLNAVDSSDLVISFDDNYTTIPLTRIARYDTNGHRTKVINSELTGLELRINIDFSKACDCCEVSTDTVGLSGNNNVFLTCGTLSDCQTIIDIETELEDHEERIEALEQGGGGGITLHSELTLDDGTNPHGTTKNDVGLGNVANVDTTTTANITDSTNKRFVSDSQLSQIGKISMPIVQNTDSSITGSTNQTVVANLLVPASSIGANGVIQFKSKVFKNTLGTGTVTARYYLSTDATNTVGSTGTPTNATLIGTITSGTQTNSYTPFVRSFANKNSESLNEILLTTFNTANDETINIGALMTTLNINTAVNLYLVETLQLSSAVDTATLKGVQIYINKP
jgi:hypothetical protein